MTGLGHQAANAARLEEILAAKRAELAGQVQAVVTFRGYRPGSGAAMIQKGRRLPADHPLVARYPERFGPVPAFDVTSEVSALRAQLAGLDLTHPRAHGAPRSRLLG